MTLTKEILQETSLVRIVDDDPALRRALTFFLKVEGWKSVSYDGPFSFLEKDDPKMPGCLVLDLKMPGATGTDLQHQLKVEENVLPVIFLSAHGDIDTAVYAVLEGAVDFLQKPVDTDELVRTLRECLEKTRRGLTAEEAREAIGLLTPRERQISKLLLQGVPNHGIAERLSLSVRTVENHRTSLYRKLRVNSYEELKSLLCGWKI